MEAQDRHPFVGARHPFQVLPHPDLQLAEFVEDVNGLLKDLRYSGCPPFQIAQEVDNFRLTEV